MTGVQARRGRAGELFALVCFGVAVAVVAVVGGWASASAPEQYARYAKPSWAPPPWLFGPVWTVLYGTVAVAGWLVWRRAGWTMPAHGVYAAQLVINMLWSPLFFGVGALGLALAEILLLAAAVAATIALFARISRPAALLLVPYQLWVLFAAALNLAIWLRNPS